MVSFKLFYTFIFFAVFTQFPLRTSCPIQVPDVKIFLSWITGSIIKEFDNLLSSMYVRRETYFERRCAVRGSRTKVERQDNVHSSLRSKHHWVGRVER